MPVPGSGELSLGKIGKELRSSDTDDDYDNGPDTSNATSLKDASEGDIDALNTANNLGSIEDPPYAMSEFYSYDHNLVGIGAPSSLTYSPTSTTTITFGFTEAPNSTRVYVYLVSNNGATTFANQVVSVNGSGYLTVDGSGTTSFVIGNGDDTYPGTGMGSPPTLTAAANDFITLKYKSYDSGGNYSDFSSNIIGWTAPTIPGAPSLTANSTTQITATWSNVTGNASNNKIFTGTSSSPTSEFATVGGGDTSDAITSLSANTLYYVRLKSVGGGGADSAYGSEASAYTDPNAPGAPALGSETTSAIAVSWSAPTGGASSYILYMETGDTTPDVSVATPSGTSVTISSLDANTRYYARLKSVGAGGSNSSYGSTSNTYTLPNQVANLTSPSKTATTVNLDWDAVSGGTQSYKVEYKENSAGSWTTFATGVTDSDDQVTSLTASTLYNFRVSAANGGGAYGAVSSTLNVTTDAAVTSWGGITNFTIDGAQNEVVYQQRKEIDLTNGSGNSTFYITTDNDTGVTVDYFSISTTGDPGESGTDNSASGWTAPGYGNTVTLSATGTYYLAFKTKIEPQKAGGWTHRITLNCTNNSVTDQTTITVEEE